ncbi:MAG: hypothetical protein D6795_14845, partial [Deltaproteobacteria bacterium]
MNTSLSIRSNRWISFFSKATRLRAVTIFSVVFPCRALCRSSVSRKSARATYSRNLALLFVQQHRYVV